MSVLCLTAAQAPPHERICCRGGTTPRSKAGSLSKQAAARLDPSQSSPGPSGAPGSNLAVCVPDLGVGIPVEVVGCSAASAGAVLTTCPGALLWQSCSSNKSQKGGPLAGWWTLSPLCARPAVSGAVQPSAQQLCRMACGQAGVPSQLVQTHALTLSPSAVQSNPIQFNSVQTG